MGSKKVKAWILKDHLKNKHSWTICLSETAAEWIGKKNMQELIITYTVPRRVE